MKGIEPEAREAAKTAARREGLTLGQWLNQAIFHASTEDEAAAGGQFGAPGSQAGYPNANQNAAPQPPVGMGGGAGGAPMSQPAFQIDFSPVTDALRDLVHRLERSERRSENALTGLDETLAELAGRIERTERVSLDSTRGLDSTLTDLRERLEKSERGLERAEHINTDAMRIVERGLRTMSTRLEDAERRADEAIKRSESSESGGREEMRSLSRSIGDLAARLDNAERAADLAREAASEAIKAAQARGGSEDEAVRALERAIGNVVDHIEASDARTAKAIKALQDSVGEITEEMVSVREKANASPAASLDAVKSLEETLGALQRNISEVTGRIGQIERSSQDDVKAVTQAIEDMGGRLDRVRDAAVEAATDAARKAAGEASAGSGEQAQLISRLEARIDETAQRLEETERASAEAINSIEHSVSDIAGQMREIASLNGPGGGQAFAEPLAALESAIDEMASRLHSSDQRSAQALAKVEEISDELLRKLEGGHEPQAIEELRSTLKDVDSRLELIETRGPAAPASPPLAGPASESQASAPPPPASSSAPGAPPLVGPPPTGHGPQMGAPPFPAAPGAPMPGGPAGGRDDFLESARRAAKAAASDPHNSGARSPFAEKERTGSAFTPLQKTTSRRTALIAASLLGIFLVGAAAVIMVGSGGRQVAGPPEGLDQPPQSTMQSGQPGQSGETAPEVSGAGQDMADASEDAAGTGMADAADTGPQRAPARDMPNVVDPAQAATDASGAEEPDHGATGSDVTGPTAITPRKEVDVAALPEPRQQAALPRPESSAAALPARQTLREAAAGGDPTAEYEVGARYAAGTDGVSQDYEQAAFWFSRSAEQGLAMAQYRLGTLFEKGLGVPENPTKARSWYERAAGQGNVKSMHNLAVMMAEGAGGEQDFQGAARWFAQAAEHGLADSQYNLAILYERGLGVERDMAKAYQWFSIASASGDADAASRAEALKNSVDAAKLVDAELAARTFKPKAALEGANKAAWVPDAATPAMVREAQRLLGQLGYNAGPADGVLGDRTVDAVREFEKDRGMAVTGRITSTLVEALQRAAL